MKSVTARKVEPAELLREAHQRLRAVFEGALTLSFGEPQITSREKGLYGYLYGKPIRRLASALSIDREILILFSTFADQQQRTVKIAKELISETEGRLESTVCIIVHGDPDGNAKLPKWGRSVGLAVLPIYTGRVPSTTEDLESQLRNELFSHDPFDITGPVSDDENFFGRRNEALDLVRKLQKGQIRSSLGIRKIGKTSIMNRVIWEAKEHYDCCCVLIDCSLDEIWSLDAAGLMRSLSWSIKQMKSDSQGYVRVSAKIEGISLSEATSELQFVISGSEKPILIFIDEVDYITPGSPTSSSWKQEFNKFWRNFRAVYQESTRNGSTVSVMVSGVSAKWFSVSAIEGVENAALSFIPEEYLSPLSRRASIGMLRKIARTAGLTFTEAAADAIATAASDMPFWMRKAASYVHQHIDIACRPLTVELDQINPLITDFLKREGHTLGQVAITHLFSAYPELREPAFNVLDRSSLTTQSRYLTVLQRYGILNSSGTQLSGRMIEVALQAFREQECSDLSGSIAEELPKQVSSLADWAEELAIINKTRNVLEKKLRQLVLNFLRADSIAHKDRGSAKERILSIMNSDRKRVSVPMNADDIIEKLFWLELTGLIKKEWQLFSSVFGDKRLFEDHSAIVNDRPDTHAKEADLADMALQRRSLKWLGDRITAL